MNEFGALPNGDVIARSALIDAISALNNVSETAFIVVGAQAVYLRTEQVQLRIPPYTLDGDIVADPRRVRRARIISETLESANFEIRGYGGLYHLSSADHAVRIATRIDVFVPARFENDWDLNGYNQRDARAVMSQAGLEIALTDHSIMELHGLNGDNRRVNVKVAGAVALLIAKGWKIGERYEKGPEEFQKVGKDVADVYRLLLVHDADELSAALRRVPKEPRYSETIVKGTQYLKNLCTHGSPGLELLRQPRLFGDSEEANQSIKRLGYLVEEFCGLVAANG